MKITKRQLRRIIREEKKGLWANIHAKKKRGEKSDPRSKEYQAAKKAGQKINKEADSIQELGHIGDPRDELATQIRHASKDIYGTKDHYDLRGKSMEELEDILYDLSNSPEQRYLDDEARIEMEDEMGYDSELSRAEMAPRRQGMSRRPGGSKSQRRMESKIKITKNQLRKIIREELIREMAEGQDLSRPIPIDDLQFVDDGYGSMMMPGVGHSYSVREQDFEAEKLKIKAKYGDDVMISVPNPGYPKSRKLHSSKFDSAQSRENQNFMRHQKMMRDRLGREPGLGS